jgi:RNA polymerase primary sigma factor
MHTAPPRGRDEHWPDDNSIADIHAPASGAEDCELDLTPGMLEKDSDPVRMYFHEMGTVSLLTRKGEVAIAKRIERGQLLVLKALSRSPIVLKELMAISAKLRKGTRSIKEIVRFDHDELAEENIKRRTRQILHVIDKIDKLHQMTLKQAAKLAGHTPRSKKRADPRAKFQLARMRIAMSRLVCSIDFSPSEKKRLIDRVRQTVDQLHSLEREVGRLVVQTTAAVTGKVLTAEDQRRLAEETAKTVAG